MKEEETPRYGTTLALSQMKGFERYAPSCTRRYVPAGVPAGGRQLTCSHRQEPSWDGNVRPRLRRWEARREEGERGVVGERVEGGVGGGEGRNGASGPMRALA